MKIERLKIISDGTAVNTHVFIGDREMFNIRALKIEIGANDLARVTLEVYADEIELTGAADVSFVRVEDAAEAVQ